MPLYSIIFDYTIKNRGENNKLLFFKHINNFVVLTFDF